MNHNEALRKAFLLELQAQRPNDIPRALIDWFSIASFGTGLDNRLLDHITLEITDGPGDGSIDAYVKDSLNRDIHLYQFKYHAPALSRGSPTPQNRKEFLAFRDAAAAFRGDTDFDAYLRECVSNKELHHKYRDIHRRGTGGSWKLSFHFVSLHSKVPGVHLQKRENIRCLWHDDVMSLFAESLIDWRPPLATMILRPHQPPLSHKIRFGGSKATASVASVAVCDFLTYMERDPAHRLFSGNVRDFLGEKDLNLAIQATFESEPSAFWWSNNGITIICEEAPYVRGRLEVVRPCVINGCQTLNSCFRSKKRNVDARVLVRLVEVGPYTTAKLDDIQKTIERTNHQNRIALTDLRANDQTQVRIQRELFRNSVFYERRKGSYRHLKTHLEVNKKYRINPLQVAQAIRACDDADDSPVDAKQKAESLFEAGEYRDLFNDKLHMTRVLQLVAANRLTEDALSRKPDPKNHPRFCVLRLAARAMEHAVAPSRLREVSLRLIRENAYRNALAPAVSRIYEDCARAWRKKRGEIDANKFFKSRDLVRSLVRSLDGSYTIAFKRALKKASEGK